MIVYSKSWKGFGTALIVAGVVFLTVFVLVLQELLAGGDYISLIIMFVVGVICIISGILVKRWARKNGKK